MGRSSEDSGNGGREWWRRPQRRRSSQQHTLFRPEKGWEVQDETGKKWAFREEKEDALEIAKRLQARFGSKVFSVVEEDPTR